MTMAGSQAVDWTPLDHAAREPVRIGDMISADAGGMPIYRVIAVEKGQAWVAPAQVASAQGAPVRAMPLDGFAWRGTPEPGAS
jgi:hypothetical protein